MHGNTAKTEIGSVLVVDDDPGDVLLTRHVVRLSNRFGEVLTAESADEGLDLFRNFADSKARLGPCFPPRLVLLDISMPGKTGHDFLAEFAELRKREDLRCVVIAMLSSSSAERDRRSAAEHEFVIEYLVKPLKLADVESIRRSLDPIVKRIDT